MDDNEKEFREALEGTLEKALNHLEIAKFDIKNFLKEEKIVDDLIKLEESGENIDTRGLIKAVKGYRFFCFQANKYLGFTNYSCSHISNLIRTKNKKNNKNQ